MSWIVFITAVIVAAVAMASSLPWVPIVLWGSVGTCAMAAGETKSIEPLYFSTVPAMLLFYPEVLGGLSQGASKGIISILCLLAAVAAMQTKSWEESDYRGEASEATMDLEVESSERARSASLGGGNSTPPI